MKQNNGYNECSGLYSTRYYAKKVASGNDIVVKVDGGYTIMSPHDYNIWKKQK